MLENLTIALEPEAVSIYCQFMKFFKEDASCPAFDVLKSGTKYMVVDLGGNNNYTIQAQSYIYDIVCFSYEHNYPVVLRHHFILRFIVLKEV